MTPAIRPGFGWQRGVDHGLEFGQAWRRVGGVPCHDGLVRRVEVRAGVLVCAGAHVLPAGVDHRSAYAFGKARLPVGAAVVLPGWSVVGGAAVKASGGNGPLQVGQGEDLCGNCLIDSDSGLNLDDPPF